MAKLFNDKIISSLRKSAKCNDDDSSAYDPGDTFVIQQVDGCSKKKPVFRRKSGGCGEGHGDCCYCKQKTTKTFKTSIPVVSTPVSGQRSHKQYRPQRPAKGPTQTALPTKCSESESDRDQMGGCGYGKESKELISDDFSDYDNIESKSSIPFINTALGGCTQKLPGLCYDGMCPGPNYLDYKNVSFFRSILGPYPDEPLLGMIDKFLSFIGFGGGLSSQDMNRLAMLDEVAEYMPDSDE